MSARARHRRLERTRASIDALVTSGRQVVPVVAVALTSDDLAQLSAAGRRVLQRRVGWHGPCSLVIVPVELLAHTLNAAGWTDPDDDLVGALWRRLTVGQYINLTTGHPPARLCIVVAGAVPAPKGT